jgi:hypothetical protein
MVWQYVLSNDASLDAPAASWTDNSSGIKVTGTDGDSSQTTEFYLLIDATSGPTTGYHNFYVTVNAVDSYGGVLATTTVTGSINIVGECYSTYFPTAY